MKGNVDITSILHGFVSFIRRFHTIIFFLAVSGGLFVAIAMLLSIIALSSSTATSSNQTINGSFDEATIQRLKASDQPAGPQRRASPFVE